MILDQTAVLVTGGATRLGRAIVLELAGAGCDVAIHYRRSAVEASELADKVTDLGRRTVTPQGDLNNPSCWESIIRETVTGLGRLDILVNNAAEYASRGSDTVDGFDPDFWERTMRVNLIAPMGLSHHAHRHLAEHGAGKIVNLCDICDERPWSAHLAYCASKAALSTLTRALARAMAPNVQVNGVAPGIAEFPESFSEEQRRRLVSRVPLKRPGTPAGIAKAVRFLVEDGDYVTGEIICVDGGLRIT